MTRHCTYRGAPVTRYRDDFHAFKNAFSNKDHHHRYQRVKRSFETLASTEMRSEVDFECIKREITTWPDRA